MCPPDRTAIVKELVLVNGGLVTAAVVVTYRLAASGVDNSVMAVEDVASGRVVRLERFTVLHEGDSLRLAATPELGLGAWAFGALLAGDPA